METAFSTEPIAVGEARPLQVHGVEPIAVEIKCFSAKPPPPGFKPCAECGSFEIRSGETMLVSVTLDAFRLAGGSIEVVVADATGQEERFSLEVTGWGEPGAEDLVNSTTLEPDGDGEVKPDREKMTSSS